MASIENRSHHEVTVKHRDDLTQTFAHNARPKALAYCASLTKQGFKPKLSRQDNYYAVRDRSISRAEQTLYASSKAEAQAIKNRLESEQQQGLFINYAEGYKNTLADLMVRYLREESPRHKGFEVEAYIINALLADAGLARQDLNDIIAKHPNPHPSLAQRKPRKTTGTRVRQASEASKFIRKPFADIVPVDIQNYVDARQQSVAAATVDREIDILSAVCNIAIDTWRIHVAKNPMDGLRRKSYCNERDRRLKSGEEERLVQAAYDEDAQKSIEARLEQLMVVERDQANKADTVYQRKQIIKSARQRYMHEAERTYVHIPLFETLVQFQLMTAARRSETLTLTWANVDLDAQTAYLPETKNGRARKVQLRSDLVARLRQLPRANELVFPIGIDGLRKAWSRICEVAGLTGADELHLHDLRHEAISRVAEAGSNTPGGFSLVDLQHFSGHRDVRMLLRYAHLCTQSLAKRLDAAFATPSQSVTHQGRRRLKSGAAVTLKEVLDESTQAPPPEVADSATTEVSVPPGVNTPAQQGANVIRVNFTRRAA